MKLIISTIAVCALLSLSATAQTGFPQPPPELSGTIEYAPSMGASVDEGPTLVIGEGPADFEEGLSISEETGPVMLMAQTTAPAPPQGGGNAVYMTQGPGGPGPGDHFQMRVPGPHKWWKDSNTVKQLQLTDGQATQIEQ